MSAAKTWGDLCAATKTRLIAGGIANINQESQWLVEEVSGMTSAELIAATNAIAPARAVDRLESLVDRRLTGEPLQYVLGRWSFCGIDLMVDRRVLIPRPETEGLVELARAELVRLKVAANDVVVDLGTGSGAIAIGLAAQLPGVEIWATDREPSALEVARANLAGVGRMAVGVRVAQGSWFDALPVALRGRIRMVVSNPPYLTDEELADQDELKQEPVSALVSGPTGLECISIIVEEAMDWLTSDGVLLVELDPRRADAALQCARNAGFTDAAIENDLAGRARVLIARR